MENTGDGYLNELVVVEENMLKLDEEHVEELEEMRKLYK
jgi:hypothetical protein